MGVSGGVEAVALRSVHFFFHWCFHLQHAPILTAHQQALLGSQRLSDTNSKHRVSELSTETLS